MPRNKKAQKPSVTPTQRSLLKERIESLKENYNKKINTNEQYKLSVIKALLLYNYPGAIKKCFGDHKLIDVLGQSNKLTNDQVVQLASWIIQNNATDSMRLFLDSYGKLLSTNDKFIDCIASILKDEAMLKVIIESKLNFVNTTGKNLLHRAVDANNMKLIQMLSETPKDLRNKLLTQEDRKGRTATEYSVAYLHKDIIVEFGQNTPLSKALSSFKQKNDQGLKVVEILIKGQNDKLLKIKDKDIYKQIEAVDSKINSDDICYPTFATINTLNKKSLQDFLIQSLYNKAIYNGGYTRQDWDTTKKELAIKLKDLGLKDNIDEFIDEFNDVFQFSLLYKEELTIETCMELYPLGKNQKNYQEVKLFILSKLAAYNVLHGNIALALSQASEALELAKAFNDDAMRSFEWYKNSMYTVNSLYAEVSQRFNKDYEDPALLDAIQKAKGYASSNDTLNIKIIEFVRLLNMGLSSSKDMYDLLGPDNTPLRAFLNEVILASTNPKLFFEPKINSLINVILDTKEKEICEKLLTSYMCSYAEDLGKYKDAIEYYMAKDDIISIARVCQESLDQKIITRCIEFVGKYSQKLQNATREELFYLAKASLHVLLEQFELSTNILLSIKLDKIDSLPTEYKNLLCNMIAYVSLKSENDVKKACIEKIRQIDNAHPSLDIILIEDEESIIISGPNQEVLDPINPEIPNLLTKAEILSLTEVDFFKKQQEGKISVGLQKAYYKHFKQNQLKDIIKTGTTQCFSKKYHTEHNWIINDSCTISTNKSDVYKVTDNLWATINRDTLDKLDYAHRIMFENAITKGIALPKKNGIKFIANLVELKINADLRLYTKVEYVNSEGKYIIIFDKSGNHEVINREVNNNTKIEVCYAGDASKKDLMHDYAQQYHNSSDTTTFEDGILAGDHSEFD